MSKTDLIDGQGQVVAVQSGGLYRVECDQGHEVLAQLSGKNSAIPDQGRPGRPRQGGIYCSVTLAPRITSESPHGKRALSDG